MVVIFYQDKRRTSELSRVDNILDADKCSIARIMFHSRLEPEPTPEPEQPTALRNHGTWNHPDYQHYLHFRGRSSGHLLVCLKYKALAKHHPQSEQFRQL